MALEQFEATIIYAIIHLAIELFHIANEFSLVHLFLFSQFIVIFVLLLLLLAIWSYCCGA